MGLGWVSRGAACESTVYYPLSLTINPPASPPYITPRPLGLGNLILGVSTPLPQPPPPSRPNASRRWIFRDFRCLCHHRHLPRVQTRAGGGFDVTTTTTTSLASKCELEVEFSDVLTPCHHHHLPLIQKRAGGGVFGHFDAYAATSISLASKSSAAISTSVASKRESEVKFSAVSSPLLPPSPSSHPNASRRCNFGQYQSLCLHLHLSHRNASRCFFSVVSYPLSPPPSHLRPHASQRYFFWLFRTLCHHLDIAHFQIRARGGVSGAFDALATTSPPLQTTRGQREPDTTRGQDPNTIALNEHADKSRLLERQRGSVGPTSSHRTNAQVEGPQYQLVEGCKGRRTRCRCDE
jgi:hypothetical protein